MNCRARGRSVPSSEELSADIERIQQIWETTRAGFGSEGPFLFGPFTIADAFFAPVVCRFVTGRPSRALGPGCYRRGKK